MLNEFNWIEATGSSPIFMVLVLFSVVTLGVVLERVYYYWQRRGNPDETLANVLEKIRTGNLQSASRVCESTAHPVGTIAAQAFTEDAAQTMEERFQIALSQQKLLLERNLNVLGTMAAIAPLVGLLGTVWGIMRAFSDMAQVGSAAPSVVAAGVAEALVTTAAGLIVAVPALILYNHFSRKMNVMLTIAENHARRIRAGLIEREVRENKHGDTPRDTGGNKEPDRRVGTKDHTQAPVSAPAS